jgi:hypothetical protein
LARKSGNQGNPSSQGCNTGSNPVG